MSSISAPLARTFTKSEMRRAIIGGTVGNVLEWYDFAVYGYLATTMGVLFFPTENKVASTLAAFGVFAVGYFMRPLGGIVLGSIGDRYGRKRMLIVSIVIMGVASFLIGVLPTHASIGIAAPILLTILRMAQGFSVGGEYTGSMTYTTEVAPPNRRGLLSSFATVGAVIGLLLGSATDWILTAQLGDAGVVAWGWRLPFLMGLPICLLGLWLREHIPETMEPAKDATVKDDGFQTIFQQHWRDLIRIVGIVTGASLIFYLLYIWVVDRAQTMVENGTSIQAANTFNLALIAVWMVLGGWLSDRYGRRSVSIFCTAALLVFSIPGTLVLMGDQGTISAFFPGHTFDATIFFVAQAIVGLPIGLVLGVQGAMIVEITPAALRCRMFSLAYSFSMAFLAGTSPFIATLLADEFGWLAGPGVYSALFCAWAFVSLWFTRETAPRALR